MSPVRQNRHATQAKAIPDYNVSRQRTRKLRDSAHDYNLQEILKYVGLNCILFVTPDLSKLIGGVTFNTEHFLSPVSLRSSL